MTNDFTICCLCYGNYPELAQRMLASIKQTCPQYELRIGLNEVCDETKQIVRQHSRASTVIDNPTNHFKYPVMRRLFRVAPITTKYIMWFDDDSYIEDGANEHTNYLWQQRVLNYMMDEKRGQIGSVYKMWPVGKQIAWMRAQPWYRGPDKHVGQFRFITGGWWVARTEVIMDLDYPWKELQHNGGDVMLSQAIMQQGLHIAKFRDHLAINADEHGRESEADRRGANQRPIGADFTPVATGPRVNPIIDI